MKPVAAHYITVGGKRLPLIVKKHPHARNLVVRYDARDACVRLTVPRYTSLQSAVTFAQSKAEWVEKQLGKTSRIVFEDGTVIPLWGEEVRLRYVGGRGVVSLMGNTMHVTGARESMARWIRDSIVKEMKARSTDIAQHYATILGVTITNIRISDMRSRWGSCSHKGGLSFSLRLAFAPSAVFDYVVCHEVAHIVHHNHSDKFWRLVESLCPDYRIHEKWLTQHGQSVWVYG